MSGGPWFSIPRSSPVPADAPSARPGISGIPAAEGHRPFCRKKTRQQSPTQCLTSIGASAGAEDRWRLKGVHMVASTVGLMPRAQCFFNSSDADLDEIFVSIPDETHYLWRAVDHEGEVLEACVAKKQDGAAALMFLRRGMKRFGNSEVVVPGNCPSYRAAMKVIGNGGRLEAGLNLNNCAGDSHQPFRRRERAMSSFKRIRSLQKFASCIRLYAII